MCLYHCVCHMCLYHCITFCSHAVASSFDKNTLAHTRLFIAHYKRFHSSDTEVSNNCAIWPNSNMCKPGQERCTLLHSVYYALYYKEQTFQTSVYLKEFGVQSKSMCCNCNTEVALETNVKPALNVPDTWHRHVTRDMWHQTPNTRQKPKVLDRWFSPQCTAVGAEWFKW